MTAQQSDSDPDKRIGAREWIGLVFVYLLMPALLLVCGGDWAWLEAWLFSLLIVAVGIGGRWWAEKRHPGILQERVRFTSAEGIKAWDKVLAPLMALGVGFPLVIVAGLDHRYGESASFPPGLSVLGWVLMVVGYLFADWALAENRFFSGVVRIQSDRGHTVCDTGPYRIVRHPGYAGNILALPGVALALGSVWTFIPAAFAILVAVVRTALEDRTLQQELPGYREYAQRVRFRLVPGIY